MIHRNLIAIAGIFFEYCKKGNAVGGAGKNASDGFTMSQREWVGMCKDAKIPVPIGEINDAHRRCDRATKEEKEEAMKKKGSAARSDKQLNLGEFLEALLRLSVKLLATSASGRKALKAGNGGEGFAAAGEVPAAAQEKDSMASSREHVRERGGQRVLNEMKEPLTSSSSRSPSARRRSSTRRRSQGRRQGEPVEEPLLTVEDFVRTSTARRCSSTSRRCARPDPGNPDVNCEIEFSRLDERGSSRARTASRRCWRC